MPGGRGFPTVVCMTGMDTTGAHDADLKKELSATLQARRELGDEYESALVDSFLEKVDQRIDGSVERRVRRQLAEQQMVVARDSRGRNPPTPSASASASASSRWCWRYPCPRSARSVRASPACWSRGAASWASTPFQAARSSAWMFGRHKRSGRDSDWED